MPAVYYQITDYEAGFQNTGSRRSNYHCACEIFDENKLILKNNPLSDVFYGKWPRCEKVIRKWRKACEKSKLLPLLKY